MKPKIFAVALFAIAVVTSSFATKPKPLIATRQIPITAPFQKIAVDDYINIILVQDPNRIEISISGDEKSVQSIEVNIVNNQLRISSGRNLHSKKITIYIPVKNLSEIELSNGSTVSGEGVLKFDNLSIFVSDDSFVALNAFGKITIKPTNNCDFVYEKNERYKVISAAL